ncbi:MAG: DUF1476 domain-containing protein [Sphingomonadales bacterium]|jgi:hypothetical protein
MTTFDNREKGFENAFAHDDQLRFKAEMRRDRLIAEWAAELFGLSGEDAEAYVKEVVRADLQEVGDDDVFRKVKADFIARGVEISDHRLHKAMDEKLIEARRQIMQEAD